MAASSTPKPPSGWKPDPRDRYILNVLYETGYMQEPQFRSLYALSEASVNARLKRLVDEGFIERKKPAADEAPSRVPFVYQIAPKAYDHLAPLAVGQFRRHKPIAGQQLNSTTISHPLAVAGLTVALLTAPAGTMPAFDWWGEHRGQMRLPITVQHPQSESLVQPDGVIRLLSTQPTDWITGHSAPAVSAWWVEVDRGTEDQRKWAEKIARFARAINQRAWEPVLGKIERPGLLITVNSEADMLSRALWIAHAAAAQGRPIDWPVWIAPHRAVVEAGSVAAGLWRQVQIHANTNQDNVLWGTWPLEAILTRRETYPVQAAIKEQERRRDETARKKAEAERLKREREQADRQKQEDERAARRRQQDLAAQQAAPRLAPQPERQPTDQELFAQRLREIDEWVERDIAEAEERRRVAEAAEAERQQIAAAYRRSFAGRVDALSKPLGLRPGWWRDQRSRLSVALWAMSLVALLAWIWFFCFVTPTLGQITEWRALNGVAFLDHMVDYYQSPQYWWLTITVATLLMAMVMIWGEQDAAAACEP